MSRLVISIISLKALQAGPCSAGQTPSSCCSRMRSCQAALQISLVQEKLTSRDMCPGLQDMVGSEPHMKVVLEAARKSELTMRVKVLACSMYSHVILQAVCSSEDSS